MTDDQLEAHFKIINERLTKIEKAQGIFTTDLERDRGDLHDFTVEVARLGAIVEGVRKGQKLQTEKVIGQMDEVGSAIVEETSDLKDVIKRKTFVPFSKNMSWKFWKRRG